ncbi:MAG TPA: NAD-dependent epimerase/dehydratase family protein [Nitrospirales bacterium]|nr:NAD-dependent epimerase/dehydratase family protein [Nitrospirales bacterium]
MKTYIILGGNGVFGVHTAAYLLKNANPRKVICVGRNGEKLPAYTLDVGRGDSRYAYHQIHIVYEQDRLFELFDVEKPEVIINFAALAHGASWAKSWRFYDTNVTALAKIVEGLLSREYLERWIQVGSSELYGAVDSPATEETALKPSSPYGISKMAGDLHLVSMFDVRKFPMNIIRPSNGYGEGQQLYRVVPAAVVFGLTGQKLPLQGGGTARKSYLHAYDIASAIHLIAEKASLGKIYNVGPPDPISIRDLVAHVADALGMPFDNLCKMTPGRAGEDAQYWLDSSAIKQDLGWKPEISLEKGVKDMVNWGKKYLDFLRTESNEFVLRA